MSDRPASDVTRLLRHWRDGKDGAREELWQSVYGELKRLAHHILRHRTPHRPLQTTALVHEAYLRLIGTEDLDYRDRGHFFAIAARAMRFILVDDARRRSAARHGGGDADVPLERVIGLAIEVDVDLLALDDALRALAEFAARQSRIVELAYFGGLTYEEIAAAVEISPATVKRELRAAKLWLMRELEVAG